LRYAKQLVFRLDTLRGGRTIEDYAEYFVCPLLIGLEPSDIKGPLAQFQATRTAKDELLRLLKTLNTALGEAALTDAHIEESFEVWWPKLQAALQTLPAEDSVARPTRSDRDVLEEILSLVRNQSRLQLSPSEPPDELYGVNSLRTIMGEIFRAAEELDPPSGYTLKTVTEAPELQFKLRRTTGEGPEYDITLPSDITADRVAPMVRHQLRTQIHLKKLTSIVQGKSIDENT
jgi:hypothetical protein